MKDLFAHHARDYARHRPAYPASLVQWLVSLCREHELAWDCGTGNGQLAVDLAPHFWRIYASDGSAGQIHHARPLPNIAYHVEKAEHCSLADGSVDLLTVAQAVHWFDFKQFAAEAERVLKRGGVLALIGYQLLQIDPSSDALILDLYDRKLAGHWAPERRHIDNDYAEIPFPYPLIPCPVREWTCDWTLQQVGQFLYTWSAVQTYMRQHPGEDPVLETMQELAKSWKPGEVRKVCFPLISKVGRKEA